MHKLVRLTVFTTALLAAWLAFVGTALAGSVRYHLGNVQHHPKFFAVYWLPSGELFEPGVIEGNSKYRNRMRQFLEDLPKTNLANVVSQYRDEEGGVEMTRATFGGEAEDTEPYPSGVGPGKGHLEQSDVQKQVEKVLREPQHAEWAEAMPNATVVVFLPKKINACDGTGDCTPEVGTGKEICGYHWYVANTIYALLPEDATLEGCTAAGLPQGDVYADTESSPLSHELFEAATNPQNPGGYGNFKGQSEGEIGDLCAKELGFRPFFGPSGYNVDGRLYSMQDEFSNLTDRCEGSDQQEAFFQVYGPFAVNFGESTGPLLLARTAYNPELVGAEAPTVSWGDGQTEKLSVGLDQHGDACGLTGACELKTKVKPNGENGHTYQAPGTYNITVTYDLGCCISWNYTTQIVVLTPKSGTTLSAALATPSGKAKTEPTVTVNENEPVVNVATLRGPYVGLGVSGTVTYGLYKTSKRVTAQAFLEAEEQKKAECVPGGSAAIVPFESVTLTPERTDATTHELSPSAPFSTTEPGFYYWQTEYSGEQIVGQVPEFPTATTDWPHNAGSASACGSEVEIVRSTHPRRTQISAILEQVGKPENQSANVLTVPEGAEVAANVNIFGGAKDQEVGRVAVRAYVNATCTAPVEFPTTGDPFEAAVPSPTEAAPPKSVDFTPASGFTAGTYYIQAEYAGDVLNIDEPTKSKCGDKVLIVKASTRPAPLTTELEGISPAHQEIAGKEITVQEDAPVRDTALLHTAGVANPVPSDPSDVKFKIFTDSACTHLVASPQTLLRPAVNKIIRGGQFESAPEELSAGTYYFQAEFAGNETENTPSGGNAPSTSKCGEEKLTVEPGKPTTVTTKLNGSQPTISVFPNQTVDDVAEVKGEKPSGKVTFAVYSDDKCTQRVPGTGANAAEVEKNNSAGIAVSEKVGGLVPGTYYWQAKYEGDANNAPSTSGCGEEVETVQRVVKASLSIETLQEIKGSGAGFTKQELTGEAGQTVDYEVILRNTGTVTLELSNFKEFLDIPGTPSCEHITAGLGTLAGSETTTYTCEYTITKFGEYDDVADITANANLGEGASNVVVVNVPRAPAFSVRRLQRLAGEKTFTTNDLTGRPGGMIEYAIPVKNTGNVPLEVQPSNLDCEQFTLGKVSLAPGEETTYHCTEQLFAPGNHATAAEFTGNEGSGTHKSNEVAVNVSEEPSFMIEELQKIALISTPFSAEELSGQTGETVEYAVTVTNTGNVALKLGALNDPNCEGISPAGEVVVAVGRQQAYTCFHGLATAGAQVNQATIEGCVSTLLPCLAPEAIAETSTARVVNVAAKPSFAIEKLQRIGGSGSFTTSALSAKIGQTVEYEDIVRNTGNTALLFGKLTDEGCEGISPGGEVPVALGGEQTYTCHHKLTPATEYASEARIKDDLGQSQTSNKAIINIGEEPSFAIEKLQRVEGAGSFTEGQLVAAVGQTIEYEVVVKNTGNVALKFSNLKDSSCEGVSPAGEVGLAVGGEQTYTCEHLLETLTYANEATIEDDRSQKRSSNKVVIAQAKPSFTLETLQHTEGPSSFSNSDLSATVGATVEYVVLAKNTGNIALKFKPVSDSGCEGISPAGEVEVAAGDQKNYLCHHKLVAGGAYTNEASVEDSRFHKKATSNQVVVNVPEVPAFAIEKLQRVQGAGSFTNEELTAKIGQTVEYEIIVTNTGNVALKFKALSDVGCEGVSPSGEVTIALGGEQTYTCSHKLAATGKYTNEASIEDDHAQKQTSAAVVVDVPEEPSFAIQKLQRVQGAGSFRNSELTATVTQTVEYEVLVKNTGNVALKFKALSDPGCEGISPAGEVELANGGEQTYNCSHKLSVAGKYTNEASVEDNRGDKATSSQVVVNAQAQPPPTASPTITGTKGHNGWYISNVTVKWNWSEAVGVLTHTPSNCPVETTSEGEGELKLSSSCEPSAGSTQTASVSVKVDTTPPNPPLVKASRPPDYAGGGGWYKDSVQVTFASNGDPGTGSGVDPTSIPAPVTFNTSGSHTAQGTVSDIAGNVSQPGKFTVQVDATPPTLQITCPTSVLLGTPGVTATVKASDGQSGLASDPSGSVAIDTSTGGAKTTTETAIDNVGHMTTKSCTTQVVYSRTITGTFSGKLVVKRGEALLLLSAAKVSGPVTVEAGGALDVEGASVTGPLRASGAKVLRLCAAKLTGPVEAAKGSGSVVIGEGTPACAGNNISGPVTVSGNTAGVKVIGNTIAGSLTVTGNAGGATVIKNTVLGNLTVTGNSGTVVDKPNTVSGTSKLQ